MTTHTARKSADILAALDKLAENGMPFVDVVKRDGFSGWGVSPADSAKHVAAQEARNQRFDPLRGCTVQIHEDPGAAYWKEATKMAEYTDRIKQMAQEAGFSVEEDGAINDGVETAADLSEDLTRFAQLVAEDCARALDDEAEEWENHAELEAADNNDKYMSLARVDSLQDAASAIRARYSLKD